MSHQKCLATLKRKIRISLSFFFLWQSAEDELRTLEELHFSLVLPWSCILLLAYYHEDID